MQNETQATAVATDQALEVKPYLFFGGRCEEALAFYKEKIGAEIDCMMRFSDSPEPVGSEMCQPKSMDDVMHAQFRVGQTTILAADGVPSDEAGMSGFSLSLHARSDAEAERFFENLSEGAQIHMPLAETFFATRFGMLQDKFGVGWMVLRVKPC